MKEPNSKSWDNAIKQQVSQLYQLMQNEELEELEIKEDSFYLYLKRKSKNAPAVVQVAMPQAVTTAAAPEAAQPVKAEPAGLTVKSPIIGVFYRSN